MQGMEAGEKKTVKESGETHSRAAKIERLHGNLGKHKNAEDNLKRASAAESLCISEELHRVIFEGAVDGIIYADRTAKVIEVNPAFTQITGIPREKVVGKSAFSLIWRFAKPKDIPQLLKAVRQTVKGKSVGLYELEINNKIVEVGTLVLRKEATGITGVIRDISDRRRAEEALRESEERLREIFENSLIGLYRTTPDGRILMANPALVRMLGFTSFEELARRNLEQEGFELYSCSEFKRRIESAGRVIGLESAWRRRDGTTLFVRESAQVICDNTDNTVYYQGTVEDITERKKAEEAYRSLVDHSLQGLAIFQDGQIVFTNQAMVQITGYTVEEMLAKSPKEIRAFVHPEDRELVWERHQQRLQGKLPPERYELRGIRKDGSIRWLEIDANLVEYQGRPAIQAAYLDITDRKVVDQKLADNAAFQSVLAAIRGVSEDQSEQQIWKAFLGSLVVKYGFQMAWFGAYADCQVRPVVWAGSPGTYLDDLVLDIAEPTCPDAACAVSQCILSQKPFGYADIAHDVGFKPWCRQALDHGFGSNMALPFIVENRVEGGIMVYASIAHGFSGERTGQLQSLVDDVAHRLCERRQRKKARLALQENEERLRSIVDHSVELFYLHDTEYKLIYVSPQSEKIFGYTPEEMAVKWTAFTTDAPVNEKGFELTERAIKTGQKQEPYLLEIRRKNGEIRIIEIDESPVKNEDGKVVAISGALRDVTERKRVERALKESEAQLKRAQEVAHIGSWYLDLRTNQLTWSDETYRIFGVPIGQALMDTDFLAIVHPDDVAYVKELWEAVLQGGPYDIEHRIVVAGTVKWVREKVELEFDAEGKPIYGIGTVQDITEHKKAGDQLREYQTMLKAMASERLMAEERERHRIAIGLHDDICQKLVMSKLTLESSLPSTSDAKLTASLKKTAETISEVIRHAESLTFELSNPVLREFGFVPALEKYLATEIGGKHGMAYELEADEPLDYLEDDIKTCLFRVTRELLTNVVKHARAQKVKVSVRKTQDKAHVTVQDDGIGFKTAHIKEGDSSPVRFGLFSVREQLEHLGGFFIIDSKPGRGTVATVVI